MNIKIEKNNYLLQFNNDEALVFYNWLSNFNQSNNQLYFNDKSEQRILWDMESSFEKELSVIFDKNYKVLIHKAQTNIKNDED